MNLEKLKTIYQRYENIILYVFFGGLTTIVSWGTHFGSEHFFHVSVAVATAISWICSVTFAFITNKKFVFKNKTETGKGLILQVASFFAARAMSLGVEIIIMKLCADTYSDYFSSLFGVDKKTNEMIFKLFANVVILIINYVLSKLVIFKNKKQEIQ